LIRVLFEEPAESDWTSWRRASDRATAALIARAAAGSSLKINPVLYKKAREFIFAAFHYKCAYCESRFILDQTGDVEHYRPKLGVTDEHDRPVMVTTGRRGKEISAHPGYYWLAYNWLNLLPSCSRCNRIQKTKDGRKVGKGTRFPITGVRAAEPGDDLMLELPVFLHPYFDNPDEHLIFDSATGLVTEKTPRGKALIDLLDLNREGLPEARRESYDSALSKITEIILAVRYHDPPAVAKHMQYLQDCIQGKVPFAWPARIALADAGEVKAALQGLLSLLEQRTG
jgi:hypothetical protein